jgi:NADPH:quinone reductase-like Zn-dependent oxidoreductase
MKAVVLNKSCEAKDLKLSDIPIPEIKDNWVLVKVMAFGMNHSEVLFRKFEINNPNFKKPIVPGIECVGIVENPSNSNFKKGDKVIALMGGMGRSFNGSYEEYALIPISHVFKVNTNLSWLKLAAIPETYYTAYGSLFTCLNLKEKDSLLVRGGSSALGIASIILAKSLGCRVIATTTDEEKCKLLDYLGVDVIIVDKNNFKEQMNEKVDKILELVGAKTLLESMSYLNQGGICCHTGILGGVYALDNFDPIKQIPNGTYLTGFYSNYPKQEEINDMMDFIDRYAIDPMIGNVYPFEEIDKAQMAMEEGKTNGKVVIAVNKEVNIKADVINEDY